jgi:hypothetical protein
VGSVCSRSNNSMSISLSLIQSSRIASIHFVTIGRTSGLSLATITNNEMRDIGGQVVSMDSTHLLCIRS